VRNGVAARESAARHFVRMPTILAGIAENQDSNPRHIIEAAKEIRQVAAGNSDDKSSAQGEKFSIIINLGGDVEKYEVDITPKPQIDLALDLEKPDGNEW